MAVERYAGRIAAASSRIGTTVEIGTEVLDRSDTIALKLPGQTSANRSARMVRAGDGWLAVNLPRQSDWELIPAWLHEDANDWTDVTRCCARRTKQALLAQARVLGLAVTIVGEASGHMANQLPVAPPHNDATAAVRVVDLSALWAGPLCAALLAKAGADVVKIEDRRRPDPTPAPLSRRLNDAKRRAVFDFSEADGWRALLAELLAADVIVTSARPRAFEHLGLAPAALFARRPRLLWVAITAHGWNGQHSDRIGFGDDTAAAGGLVNWHDGEPVFIGDAVADPADGAGGCCGNLGSNRLRPMRYPRYRACGHRGGCHGNTMLIRNVSIDGLDGLDVKLEGDRITAIGKRLTSERLQFDGAGGALMMGLVDHHCHLLASAAQSSSVDLQDIRSLDDVAGRLQKPAGSGWIRAIGCPPILAEALTAQMLDKWQPGRPVRIQDQTGALWVLNSAALARIDEDLPPCVERDTDGRVTGRVWRGDAWLGQAIGRMIPDLACVGSRLARLGITAVTDASASTDDDTARLLADSHRAGHLPQHLTLMSARDILRPKDGAFEIGPVKILLDERDLPPLDELIECMRLAREQNRAVAVHCVTAAELALTLAAFETGGTERGDRIEHGNVIPADAISVIHRLRLAVIIQPGWIRTRGDRYLADVEPIDQPDLLRSASLLKTGIAVAAGSDSPYGNWDCWAAMRAAVSRTTLQGRALNLEEAITARAALDLYRAAPDHIGSPVRQVRIGAQADLCLLNGPMPKFAEELAAERVSATWIGGKLVHHAEICKEGSSSPI